MSDKTVYSSSSRTAPTLGASIDIAGVVALSIFSAILLSLQLELPIAVKALVALPFLLFLPGYAVVSALFPAARGAQTSGTFEVGVTEPTLAERIALSFGLSLAIVPVVGVIVDAVWALTVVPVLAGVTVCTVLAGFAAFIRRTRLPETQQFSVIVALQSVSLGLGNRPATKLFFVGAILLTVAALGASSVVAITDDGSGVTEFYLTTEGPDGDQVMATEETVGNDSTHNLVVERSGVSSEEHTIVVMTYIPTDDGTTDWRTLDEMTVTLDENGVGTVTHDVQVERGDRPLVLTYLLYEDEPPDEPSQRNSLRWLRVRLR